MSIAESLRRASAEANISLQVSCEKDRRQRSYSGAKPSLSLKITDTQKVWLPVESPAFEDGIIMPSWANEVVRLQTNGECTTVHELYESFGITIGEQHPAIEGWYNCKLPLKWENQTLGLDTSTSRYGYSCHSVVFFDDEHRPRFSLDVASTIQAYPFVINICCSESSLKKICERRPRRVRY